MSYTLATAAEAAKVTKPTVFRWIKAGKITATRAEDGTYRIEPVELHRYADSIAREPLQKRSEQQVDMGVSAAAEIALRCEVEKLKALLEAEKQRADEIRQERDEWRGQAQRLSLPRPPDLAKPPAVAPRIAAGPERRSWLPWRRTA